jgi:hypothetical protein
MDSEQQTVAPPRGHIGPTRPTLKRLMLAGVSAFIAVNFWTGAPVAALWVGSAVVGERELSMTAVFVVVIVLAVLEFALAMTFARVNAAHDQLTGRKRGEPRLTWLHSMNTQGQEQQRSDFPLSVPERIVVVTVYVAVIALIGWFFLFAGSPLPR